MKLTVDNAGTNIAVDNKTLLKGVEFFVCQVGRELREGEEDIISAPTEEISGNDAVGAYTGVVRSFKRDWVDSKGRHWDFAHARLEIRTYEDFFALNTSCDVEGMLESEGHFRIEFEDLPGLNALLALHMFSDWWSRPHFDTDLSKLPLRTQMLLWETETGQYACLVPLVHGGMRAQLNGRTGCPGVDLLLCDPGHSRAEGFALVGAVGDDPYELVQRCVERGMSVTGHPGKTRNQKPYPELFENIGWCTWNALYQNVNEEAVLTKMDQFRKENFPVRYILIDDGWSPVRDHTLNGYDTEREKFPRGLAPFVEDIKRDSSVDQVGVWHTFTGYWRGVHPESDIFRDNQVSILKSKRGTHIPYPQAERSFAFWNSWHNYLRKQGIGFIKVDNQGATVQHSRGTMPVGQASREQHYGLQASAGLNFNQNLINCMCMSSENIWHWSASNIARNSDDFFPNRPESACEHARQNIYNNIFFANFSYPDWDMFWSYNERADYHAAMRAISGGPVYFTDEVGQGDFSKLWPLVLSDGRLLRFPNPAMPTRDILLTDPAEADQALKSYNLCEAGGLLLALNSSDDEKELNASIRPSDIAGLSGDRFAVRDFFTGEKRILDADQTWDFSLEPYGVRLFSIVPVQDGSAVLGLLNKYASPLTVLGKTVSSAGVNIKLAEGGPMEGYFESEVKNVIAGSKPCEFTQNNGWLSARINSVGPVDVWVQY